MQQIPAPALSLTSVFIIKFIHLGIHFLSHLSSKKNNYEIADIYVRSNQTKISLSGIIAHYTS